MNRREYLKALAAAPLLAKLPDTPDHPPAEEVVRVDTSVSGLTVTLNREPAGRHEFIDAKSGERLAVINDPKPGDTIRFESI